MILLLFIVASLAYGAATFAYGADAGEAGGAGVASMRRRAQPILLLGVLGHTALIGLQCVEGDHPLKNIFLASSFGSLVAAIGFVALSRTQKIDALGAVVAPIALAALALGVVFSSVDRVQVPTGSAIASAHVGFAAAGLAGFTLAAAVAGLYLATERRLRRKQFRPGHTGISLTGLDRLHHRLVLLVTPVFTLAIVTGALWIVQIGGPHMVRGRNFELAAAAIAWVASVALLVMRAVWGSRGRQSAWLTILAFAAVLLIVVSYGVRP